MLSTAAATLRGGIHVFDDGRSLVAVRTSWRLERRAGEDGYRDRQARDFPARHGEER
ncbi:hypothetical protein [Streptomyces buecherae]|uniref:hypothetical protein n=1 Tax=Streptomyces buecherae TaxID=2763006 RepID=UPI003669DFE4